MKTCTKCGKPKPLDDFHKMAKASDGRHPYCKECKADYASKLHQNNREANLVRMSEWRKRHTTNSRGHTQFLESARREEIKDLIWRAKSSPCADCGGNFHPVVMDFDHLPEFKKDFAISSALRLGKILLEVEHEIDKCDVVCANCHRLRTHLRHVEKVG